MLTIGMFDGVHLGHQHLLARLVTEAQQRGLVPAVVTFRNHPRSVLSPDTPVALLTSFDERVALLRRSGVACVAAVQFTPEVALLSARDFVLLLREVLGMRGMVVGPGFAMGHRREGDIAVLREMGREVGFSVDVVEPLVLDGRVVSSSAVRRAVAVGDMVMAARLLGRPFALTGTVVRGDGRGRALGYPTANLSVEPRRAVPGDGIYAAWAEVGGARYTAAVSIGVRPTFATRGRVVEAYLLDMQGDLYGKELRLEFVARLREERRFEDVAALVQQIALDVERAREVLTAQTSALGTRQVSG